MAFIRTVTGDIRPEELGFTSMHEHTMHDAKKMKRTLFKSMPSMITGVGRYKKGEDVKQERERRAQLGYDKILPERNMKQTFSMFSFPKDNPAGNLSMLDFFTNELIAYKGIGGDAICDCSPDCKPTSADVKELSKRSGVKVIITAGFYTEAFIPKKIVRQGEKYMASIVRNEVKNGDGTSDARPGFVKAAVSCVSKSGHISDAEWMAVRACATVAKEEGMSLHIHTAFPLRKEHIIELADMLIHDIAIDPNRVLICHMDSFNSGSGNMSAKINEYGYDSSLPIALIKKGFHIGLDTWGTAKDNWLQSFDVEMRKRLLLELLDAGFEDYITLGHDFIWRVNGTQNGNFGYTLFPQFLKEMEQKGTLSDAVIHKLTVENPRGILSIS